MLNMGNYAAPWISIMMFRVALKENLVHRHYAELLAIIMSVLLRQILIRLPKAIKLLAGALQVQEQLLAQLPDKQSRFRPEPLAVLILFH